MKNRRGFSLLEIIMATVLLSLIITGLASVFISGKKLILHTQFRMTGGELGKYFLDPLQLQVRQDQWGTSGFSTGSLPGQSVVMADRPYTATYTVNRNDPLANITRVKVTISWPPP